MSQTYSSFGNFRKFVGSEAWRQAGTSAPTGTFYRVNTTCINSLCLTHREAQLNSGIAATNIAGVDLDCLASQEDVNSAFAQMNLPDGVIVAGTNRTAGLAGRRCTRVCAAHLPPRDLPYALHLRLDAGCLRVRADSGPGTGSDADAGVACHRVTAGAE
jgi:hypothetical protein